MSSTGAIIVTLMLTLKVFLSFAITLEAAIHNNLTKFWRFSRKMSGVKFSYSYVVKPLSLGFTVTLLMTEAVVRICFPK